VNADYPVYHFLSYDAIWSIFRAYELVVLVGEVVVKVLDACDEFVMVLLLDDGDDELVVVGGVVAI
jgi:hypothetical protein